MLQNRSAEHPGSHYLAILENLRETAGESRTVGLPDAVVQVFVDSDASLQQAIADAGDAHSALGSEAADLLATAEQDLTARLQDGLVNFYPDDVVNPYVALAACGPWIITTCGAVIHDSGGYGMLGLGHSPQFVLEAMNRRQVMANVMTPSLSQHRFVSALRQELGRTRGSCPYKGFVCLNSGSEAMTVALRLADINAKVHTDPDGRHRGKPIRRVALEQGFHGRTDGPARYSDSTLASYSEHLASFRDGGGPLTVEPNNIAQLEEVFAMADQQGFFIEAVCMEPVMGEGNPGMPVSREFYDAARRLTLEHGSFLVIDSIQAGLRAHGCLSVVDYPGFTDCIPPDLETYSKALNAGQYPLSVLAIGERAKAVFRAGIYGNTMTANPRALDVACAVLDSLTDKLRANIRQRGAEFAQRLQSLADEMGDAITAVQGTGLLISCELNPDRYKCYGAGSIEEYLRLHGIGVVHGGKHSLRFTPPFSISSAEIAMIVNAVRDALTNGPRRAA
ncbi:MAG: aminotransferase class III-fold pyridoxal phosphate-dependent enzyme [Gammaproteobacteria bacterium]|nr:aminotransferase class III-fold pyridoxal phosphate-dependent enzyme [Gammaproteobacteria bacterium]NNF60982.1 aminotransferase class III-fold pyridoxal phosphate-dependent enzyme [Gammaproteobacteria bacterium]NNM21104.1 aminotransferase class III-fold pyridoxal phosphate-dependent enzyme [Gammaproteobacteria bacterium]